VPPSVAQPATREAITSAHAVLRMFPEPCVTNDLLFMAFLYGRLPFAKIGF
jgi:hypothetical protein